MSERIDQLTGPPEVGKYYLVPTVTGEWYRVTKAWPVIGPKHNDSQCLNFEYQHYHLDARFIVKRSDEPWFWRSVMASPLQVNDRVNAGGLPEPVWPRRLCRRLVNPVQSDLQEQLATVSRSSPRWQCHFDQWTGKQSRHDGRGWVCPHRNVPLADHAAVDGVITCPLHLLRIDAATGRVLPPIGAAP